MELGFFSLKCSGVTSNGLWDIKGYGRILSCLYIEAQGSVPVLLENLSGMSCFGTFWPLGGAFDEAFDELLLLNVP